VVHTSICDEIIASIGAFAHLHLVRNCAKRAFQTRPAITPHN